MSLRVFPVLGGASYRAEFYPQAILDAAGKVLQRQHLGIDLFAGEGTPLLAVDDGQASYGRDVLGGNVVNLRSDDGARYYYAHLSGFEGGNRRVRAGDVLGYVGRTGNAAATSPHSHFEMHPGGGAAVDPYAMLRAAEVRYPASPGGLGRYVAPAVVALALGGAAWWLVSGAPMPRLPRLKPA